MTQNSKTLKRTRRVVNGLAVQNSWTWIVRLEFLTENSKISFQCGGTVIHENFVLTAAHCCIGKSKVLLNFKENLILKRLRLIQFKSRINSYWIGLIFFAKRYRNLIIFCKSNSIISH